MIAICNEQFWQLDWNMNKNFRKEVETLSDCQSRSIKTEVKGRDPSKNNKSDLGSYLRHSAIATENRFIQHEFHNKTEKEKKNDIEEDTDGEGPIVFSPTSSFKKVSKHFFSK